MLFGVSQVVESGEKQQNSKVKHVTYVAFYWVSSLWLPLFIKSLSDFTENVVNDHF